MIELQNLLEIMIERKASDLHITTGTSPQFRIDGKLASYKSEVLNAPDTKRLCYSVLTDAQRHKFEEEYELDFSFGIKGLSRFRGNIFMQRGRSEEHFEPSLSKSPAFLNWDFLPSSMI